MIYQWKVNKRFDSVNGGFSAEFLTLYSDARDIMCDDPRPDWIPSSREANRCVKVRFGWGSGKEFRVVVNREDGNKMYRQLIKISNEWNPYIQQSKVEEMFREMKVRDEE